LPEVVVPAEVVAAAKAKVLAVAAAAAAAGWLVAVGRASPGEVRAARRPPSVRSFSMI